jgi:aminoglycoside phosphotransferase (APT) family kinase protein
VSARGEYGRHVRFYVCDDGSIRHVLDGDPSDSTLAWAARSTGPTVRIVACSRLTGGITSSVHRLAVVDDHGRADQLVLKRWISNNPTETAGWIESEAQILTALEGSGLPVPALVATSRGEETDGHPALLMTAVPGRMNLAPTDPRQWLTQMATALARVHTLAVDAPAIAPPGERDRRVPAWSERPSLWEEAARVLAEPGPEESCFVHGDYQHFNLLWIGETLSGIVDWTWAGRAYPGRDVGHCRLNLAVLYSPEWAEDFRAVYEAETASKLDRWWDVFEIARYSEQWPAFIPVQVANRIPVDTAGMNTRVEDLLALALR